MATIYEFRTSPKSRSLIARMSGASAEIVFFPGVRYERYEDQSQPSKPKRKTKRRDKLELAD